MKFLKSLNNERFFLDLKTIPTLNNLFKEKTLIEK